MKFLLLGCMLFYDLYLASVPEVRASAHCDAVTLVHTGEDLI